jgi:hypothetical protein
VIDRDWYVDWAKEESWVPNVVADNQGDTLGLSFEILRRKKLSKVGLEDDTDLMLAGFF